MTPRIHPIRLLWGTLVTTIALLVLTAWLLSGCAALRSTPARLTEALSDPVRTRHLAGRVLEACAGGTVAGMGSLPFGPLIGCPAAALVEFLVYEYILEPLGLVGPYFERGPRLPVIGAEGRVVEPGEIYRESTEAFCKFHQKTWHPDPQRPSGGWCD